MDDMEGTFRHELEGRAKVGDWRGWNTARLVFADWLADNRPLEEPITRAAWEFVDVARTKKGDRERWRVALPRPLPVKGLGRFNSMFKGCVNGLPILHFPVGTLKIRHPAETQGQWGPGVLVQVLYFTFQRERKSFCWLDLGAHRQGFRALFLDNPGAY